MTEPVADHRVAIGQPLHSTHHVETKPGRQIAILNLPDEFVVRVYFDYLTKTRNQSVAVRQSANIAARAFDEPDHFALRIDFSHRTVVGSHQKIAIIETTSLAHKGVTV